MQLFSKLFGKAGVKSDLQSRIIKDLGDRGYYVIEDFLTVTDCKRILDQFEHLLVECADRIQHGEAEGTSGDYRLWRVESRIAELAPVARHPLIHAVASAYIGRREVTHAIMMNKVERRTDTATNSGGGWHRDTVKPVVKALIYLNDVGPENGPFMLIPQSRRIALPARPGVKSTRFADETIEHYTKRNGTSPIEFTGSAGTCIIADTSNVHRGKNIAAGVRYCATNYIKDDSPSSWKSSDEAWGRYFLDQERS